MFCELWLYGVVFSLLIGIKLCGWQGSLFMSKCCNVPCYHSIIEWKSLHLGRLSM